MTPIARKVEPGVLPVKILFCEFDPDSEVAIGAEMNFVK
jgi:hypothetical protein